MNLTVMQGDITVVHTHVIVNAANPALRGGSGVDGAIHRAAGPNLLTFEEWMHPHGTEVACPVVTPAFDLPARHIIHVPGPDYRTTANILRITGKCKFSDDLVQEQHELLWNAYARSLVLAGLLGAGTVTFPSLSTGIFEFPLADAAPIAVEALRAAADRAPSVNTVAIVAFDEATANAYREVL